jgi:fructose transport system ATP-binding protein
LRHHGFLAGFGIDVKDPKDYTMSDVVAFMTAAKEPPEEAVAA